MEPQKVLLFGLGFIFLTGITLFISFKLQSKILTKKNKNIVNVLSFLFLVIASIFIFRSYSQDYIASLNNQRAHSKKVKGCTLQNKTLRITETKHHRNGIYLATFLIRAFRTSNVLLFSMGFDRTIQRGGGKKLRNNCCFRVRCYYLRNSKLNHTHGPQSLNAIATHHSMFKNMIINQLNGYICSLSELYRTFTSRHLARHF